MPKTTTKRTSEKSAVLALENHFIDAIDAYLLVDRPSVHQRLLDLCEQLLDSSRRVPMALRPTIEEALNDRIDGLDWTQRGATYGGAARRIRCRLQRQSNVTFLKEPSNEAA